jgi:hypothetical protein
VNRTDNRSDELLKQAELRRKRVDEIRGQYEEEWENDNEERADQFQGVIDGKNGKIRELLERIEGLEQNLRMLFQSNHLRIHAFMHSCIHA